MIVRRISACLVAGILALAIFVAGASAQSLKEARAKEADARALQREVTYTRSVCGNEISARIDWASTAEWPQGLDLVGACDRSLAAVEAACRSGNKRAQSISRFVCAGDGAGARLRGSTLRYGAAPDADGLSETAAVLN